MISAEIIQDSVSSSGVRLTTYLVTYPHFILPQMLTHRVFSRNTSSSRAIPTQLQIDRVRNNPAMPIQWGENKPGMQAGDELPKETILQAENSWRQAAYDACDVAEYFLKLGLHKQHASRIIEPYMYTTQVITSTEWRNFFDLRTDSHSQPEIIHTSKFMKLLKDKTHSDEFSRQLQQKTRLSTPVLRRGQAQSAWHLPFITQEERLSMPLVELLKRSAACCARTSYLNHDKSELVMADDIKLHDTLKEAKHMSVFEHQACDYSFHKNVTSTDSDGNTYSGNLRGWTQYRKVLNSRLF